MNLSFIKPVTFCPTCYMFYNFVAELPDSWYDHENIADDAKGSNEEIEDTEQQLNMRIEDQVLVGTTGLVHHYF